MDTTGYVPLRRFEFGWVLAGLGWGVFLGIAAATVPTLFVMLPSGEGLGLNDTLIIPMLWLLLFAITGAGTGGVLGMVVGVVVMLAVGRDPEKRAARRTLGTVALLVAPLLLGWLLWFS